MWWAHIVSLMWSVCLCLLERSEVFGESILDSSQRIHKALRRVKCQIGSANICLCFWHFLTFYTFSLLGPLLFHQCLFSQGTDILPTHPSVVQKIGSFAALRVLMATPYPICSTLLCHPIFSHMACAPPRSPLSYPTTHPTHIFPTAPWPVSRVKRWTEAY